jgi:flavin reductase
VCSVTDDPPTLLVCQHLGSPLHSIFKKNGVFCVNTLAADQQELAELFAHRAGMPMEERFALPIWHKFATGAPFLRDALVCFDCRLAQMLEVGTHSVMFGAVQDIRISSRPWALLYVYRSYRTVALQEPDNE